MVALVRIGGGARIVQIAIKLRNLHSKCASLAQVKDRVLRRGYNLSMSVAWIDG